MYTKRDVELPPRHTVATERRKMLQKNYKKMQMDYGDANEYLVT